MVEPTPKPHVSIAIVSEYSKPVMDEIGANLMPELDKSFEPWTMPEDEFAEDFRDSNDRDMFVINLDETPVGTFTLHKLVEQHHRARAGYLGGFVLKKEARGSGAAADAWQHMLQWCRDKNLHALALNTESWRPDAIKFYKKMGAVEVSGTSGHYAMDIPERAMTTAVPQDVTRAYFGDTLTYTRILGEGLVNRTFLAQTEGRKTVLQEMGQIFDERLVTDNANVTELLAKTGWEVPQTLRTPGGELWHRDKAGRLWRQLEFIESDGAIPEALTPSKLRSVGALLGRLHRDLAELDYEPAFELDHFHETPFYARRLEELQYFLPDVEAQDFARNMLGAYEALPELPDEEPQLIHGDPQLTNILYEHGRPFTYIDFDTVMRGPIWLDIGDLLRATLEDDLKAGRELQTDKLQHIVEGYRLEARPGVDADEFYNHAITATQQIALELGMRFMNDIVDDYYFSWDGKSFENRRDNHMWRAGIQWQIHTALNDLRRS